MLGANLNRQNSKITSQGKNDGRELKTQGSKMTGLGRVGTKLAGNIGGGKSGLNLDSKNMKLLSKGSALLVRRLSGLFDPMEVEEKESPHTPRIELTPQQLEEDMPAKVLEPKNPIAPRVQISYSYINNKFERNELVDQLVMHFESDGDTIIKDSDEAKIQEEIVEHRNHLIKETVNKQELLDSQGNFDMKEAVKILRNKFNYCLRESQTPVRYVKEKGVSTIKPQLKNFSGEVNQSWIYDLYIEEHARDERENVKDKQKKQESAVSDVKDPNKQKSGSIYSVSFKKCLKIMERMIVQNEEEEKYSDYKYMFTEKGPEIAKAKEKNIYPLWRFLYPPNKKKNVTTICWNPYYTDMFAVGFGSYDFGKKKAGGSICLFSIKNTNYPEMIFQTEDGVMSIDFHPKSPALLAVGLYDGVVLVYDVRNKSKTPIYQSSIKTSKHTDPVWQVMWNPDISKYHNFYSISSDGRVMNWILMKDKLEPEEVIRLKLINKSKNLLKIPIKNFRKQAK